MKTSKPELIEKVTVRLSRMTVAMIQQSGQRASDWLRQAAQNRIDQERGQEPALGQLEKQVNGLQKEIARLQQAEALAHATLATMQSNMAAIQQHHVELRHALDQMNAGFGHAFTALGQSLLVALGQQLDVHLQKGQEQKEDEPPPFKLPPIPPRTRL